MKFHDNTVGPQYGEDHTLTNNWNPDAPYRDDEYVDVYFRIETPSYYHENCRLGFDSTADNDAFTKEKLEVFESIGWHCDKPENNGRCMEVVNGKQRLYLHPQNFSGFVKKADVKKIAEALEKHETFYLRWVDLYQTVYDVSDAKYRHMMLDRVEEIQAEIYERAKTTRRDRFVSEWEVNRAISLKYGFPRIDDRSAYERCGATHEVVKELIDDLIHLGYLVRWVDETGTSYLRSANKTELKKAKLKPLQEAC